MLRNRRKRISPIEVQKRTEDSPKKWGNILLFLRGGKGFIGGGWKKVGRKEGEGGVKLAALLVGSLFIMGIVYPPEM